MSVPAMFVHAVWACARVLRALHLALSVQEAHALQLHLSALGHQKEGRYDEARAAFEELLEADFIHTASPVSPTPWPITKGTRSLPHPPPPQGLLDQVALRLKYSSLKNLAHVAAAQGRRHTALQCYLQVPLQACASQLLIMLLFRNWNLLHHVWQELHHLPLGYFLICRHVS